MVIEGAAVLRLDSLSAVATYTYLSISLRFAWDSNPIEGGGTTPSIFGLVEPSPSPGNRTLDARTGLSIEMTGTVTAPCWPLVATPAHKSQRLGASTRPPRFSCSRHPALVVRGGGVDDADGRRDRLKIQPS